MLMQVISVLGALCVLTAYGAHQLGRMHSETYTYQFLNLLGGTLLVTAAWTTRQAGLILMEGAWTVISVYGVVKVMRSSRE
jgi:multisubunit Na+/H+ antiporter MnhB subunit